MGTKEAGYEGGERGETEKKAKMSLLPTSSHLQVRVGASDGQRAFLFRGRDKELIFLSFRAGRCFVKKKGMRMNGRQQAFIANLPLAAAVVVACLLARLFAKVSSYADFNAF